VLVDRIKQMGIVSMLLLLHLQMGIVRMLLLLLLLHLFEMQL